MSINKFPGLPNEDMSGKKLHGLAKAQIFAIAFKKAAEKCPEKANEIYKPKKKPADDGGGMDHKHGGEPDRPFWSGLGGSPALLKAKKAKRNKGFDNDEPLLASKKRGREEIGRTIYGPIYGRAKKKKRNNTPYMKSLTKRYKASYGA